MAIRRKNTPNVSKGLRGKYHDFLGINFDFQTRKHLILDMIKYVKGMLDNFPIKFKKGDSISTPAANNLLEKGKGKALTKEKREQFHSMVAKGMFVSKRARPDIHTAMLY